MPVQPMKTTVFYKHPGAAALAEDAPEKDRAVAEKLKGQVFEVEMFMIDARDAVNRFPDQYSFADPAAAAAAAAGVEPEAFGAAPAEEPPEKRKKRADA